MQSGKWQITDEIELPTQESIRTLGEKETYKYLRILAANTIKQAEIKEIDKKRIPQANEKARNQALH